jgi:hypothetical protein
VLIINHFIDDIPLQALYNIICKEFSRFVKAHIFEQSSLGIRQIGIGFKCLHAQAPPLKTFMND